MHTCQQIICNIYVCYVSYLYKYIDVIYTFMYLSYDLCILVNIQTINCVLACVHEIGVTLHACIWIIHHALFSIYIYVHYMCVQIYYCTCLFNYYIVFVYRNVFNICKMYIHCLILDKCIFMDFLSQTILLNVLEFFFLNTCIYIYIYI